MRIWPPTRALSLLAGAVALVVATLAAYFAALGVVRGAVVTALGPRGETREIRVGLAGLELEGLRLHAPSGWPAEDSLRAERVSIAPRLITLFSRNVIWIRAIELSAPYLSAVRTKRGELQVLPGLTSADSGRPSHSLVIGALEIEGGVLELFDASIASPPQKIRLEQIEASVHDLSAPGLAGRTAFELEAVVKGKAHDGRVELSGWAEVPERDYDVTIELRGVDLAPLQAYLVKPGDARVQRGSLDLDLRAEVMRGKLAARGRLTLNSLELASADGFGAHFLGVPHQVVLATMKDRGGRLTLDFTLSGDVDDPHFSLNEALGKQVAFSLAESLGLTIGGVVKGVGSLGVKGGKAAGEAAKGLGGAILDLLEGEPERK